MAKGTNAFPLPSSFGLPQRIKCQHSRCFKHSHSLDFCPADGSPAGKTTGMII